jgi:hypothetical protein
VLVFHHIPRTGGTFLNETLRNSALAGGPKIHLATDRKWVPDIYLDREFRPVLLTYHTSGAEFARVWRRRPGDYAFTFLRDRVDMVYSNYHYMRARVVRGDRFEPWAAGANEAFGRSLEEHVDSLLAAAAPDHEYPPDLGLYDFVGITEEMTRSLAALGRAIGAELRNDRVVNSVPGPKEYRRAELAAKYARERELYRLARERLERLEATPPPPTTR